MKSRRRIACPQASEKAIVAGHVRFSNRPVGVKRFQTIHHHSVDVARGLALLFGIGTETLVWGFFSQESLRQGSASFFSPVSLLDLTLASFARRLSGHALGGLE